MRERIDWTYVKALYVEGHVDSLRELSERIGVAHETLKGHSARGGWVEQRRRRTARRWATSTAEFPFRRLFVRAGQLAVSGDAWELRIDPERLFYRGLGRVSARRKQFGGDLEECALIEMSREYLTRLSARLGLSSEDAARVATAAVEQFADPYSYFDVELAEELILDLYRTDWCWVPCILGTAEVGSLADADEPQGGERWDGSSRTGPT